MAIRECRICELEFNDKLPVHKGGFINECGNCGEEDVNRHIGFTVSTGKSDYHMELMTDPSDRHKKIVRKQARSGPSQCHTSLGLGSSGSSLKAQKEGGAWNGKDDE
jgi:hypothetical protein